MIGVVFLFKKSDPMRIMHAVAKIVCVKKDYWLSVEKCVDEAKVDVFDG